VQAALSPPRPSSEVHSAGFVPDESAIRLSLLNGFELSRNGVEIPLTRGPQHLIAYLALHERAIPKAHLAGVLWADVTDARALGNLRSALWRLRQLRLNLLKPAGEYLSLARCVQVDIREAYLVARRVLDPAADIHGLRLAELPLQGELLPGWYEDWVVLERERQRQICLHSLEVLCERWAATGCYAEAVMAGLAAVSGEPYRESAHRVLIRAFLAEGNPNEAIRQYGLCREIMRRELHISPSRELDELVRGLIDS
jgi:DNA-binding SARP family transcriptional activator